METYFNGLSSNDSIQPECQEEAVPITEQETVSPTLWETIAEWFMFGNKEGGEEIQEGR